MDGDYFDTRYSYDPDRARVWRAICEYLQRFVPPGAAVLDLGAGYCDFINQIRAERRYAVDINAGAGHFCAPGVQFLCADVTAPLGIPAQSLDVVFASNLLEHLTEEQCTAMFQAVDTVLRPSGRIILLQPNYYYCSRRYWDDFTHVKAFSHVSLPDLLRSKGYKVVHVEKRFLPLSFKSTIPKSYALTKLYLHLPWRPLAGQMLVVGER